MFICMENSFPHNLYSSEVASPEHNERKSNSREMFLSTQALRHLTPSPSPLAMLEETAHTDEAEEKQPVSNVCIVSNPEINDHNSRSLILRNNDPFPLHLVFSQQKPEPPESISSSEDLSSENISSFTSASSLPLLRRDGPYEYRSTVTLQRISSLLTHGENPSSEEEEEEEESRTSLPHCPEMTADGATDPISLLYHNLKKDIVVLSSEGKL